MPNDRTSLTALIEVLHSNVKSLPDLYDRCREDPANLNNMYSLLGTLAESVSILTTIVLHTDDFKQPK